MMMHKTLILAAACIALTLAEPPSSYLPPNSYTTTNQHAFSPPSATSFDFSSPSSFSPSFSSSSLSSNYGAPIKPKTVYSAPKPVYSAPKPAYSPPRPVYSAPSVYTAPAPVYSPPAPVYSPPKTSYLPPSPSASYSAPKPKPVYGLPQSHHEDYNSEPAHYEYQYTVQDSHYGTDFAHKEGREGDVTHGQYMVLLPDGRRQIVDYVADKNGYRPTIRYEGTAVKNGY